MMVRDVLTGVAMVAALGASAFGQATFVSIEQRVAVQASCGSTSNEDRTSSVAGVFSDSVLTTNQYGLFRAAVDTNLTANQLIGSHSYISNFCGSSTVSVNVRFTLPERQKWRIRWNAGSFGRPNVLNNANGGFAIVATTTDSVELLEPGTYELEVNQGADGQRSSGGNFALTRMPPETSQQVTYQGMLLEGGVPYAGTADVQFTLFDAASGGAQVGDPIVVTGVAVSEGKFAAAFAPGPRRTSRQ